MELLKGKNVLLTGATGGIGSKTAKLLLSSGANIFITGRNAEKLEQLANELGIEPSNFCVADISKTEDIEQLKQQFFMVYSTIDVLVNAAGVGIIKPMDTLSEEDFTKTLQFNLVDCFYC
jgi:short-subunit dehydrogenase